MARLVHLKCSAPTALEVVAGGKVQDNPHVCVYTYVYMYMGPAGVFEAMLEFLIPENFKYVHMYVHVLPLYVDMS